MEFIVPGGRPKKTLDIFPKGWKEEVIELSSNGASEVELRDYLDICYDTWDRMLKEEPEFSKTIKKCRDKCRVWWEKTGRTNLHDKEFSPTLWYMNMKNRFGWKDKTDIDHTTKGEKIAVIIRGDDANL